MVSIEPLWVLPDIKSALAWCKARNKKGICCTLDVLGEDIKTEKQVEYSVESILNCARVLDQSGLDAGLAIKPSSLGAITDRKMAKRNIFQIFKETNDLNVNLEIDMEGTPLVDYTIELARALANKGYYVTLALQAYLHRTEKDIKTALASIGNI